MPPRLSSHPAYRAVKDKKKDKEKDKEKDGWMDRMEGGMDGGMEPLPTRCLLGRCLPLLPPEPTEPLRIRRRKK